MNLWSTYVVLTQQRTEERATPGEHFPQLADAAAAPTRASAPRRGRWLLLLVIVLAGLLALSLFGARRAAAQTTGLADPTRVVMQPPLSAPPVGTPFADPVFATRLRRLDDASTRGSFSTHEYSQLQAFSADSSHVLLLDGAAGYVVRRVDTLAPVTHLDTSGWNAARWHPQQANLIVHYDSNDDATIRLQQTEIANGATANLFTFPAGYERIRVAQSSDALSRDGRWLAGMATHATDGAVIFAVDLVSGVLGAQLPVAALYDGVFCVADPVWGVVEPDWIAPSPQGAHLMIQWPRDWGEGVSDHCRGLESYDLTTGAYVGRVYDGHQHGDLGRDADGSEFFMTYALAAPPPDNGRPALARYPVPGPPTGVAAPHFLLVQQWGQAGHISCQGPAGVCLVSNGVSLAGGWQAMDGELLLVYADSTIAHPHVLRLAHHRASNCGYWVQPRASLAQDGQYAVFASDWVEAGAAGSCSSALPDGAGDAYLLDLRPTDPVTPTLYLPVVGQTAGVGSSGRSEDAIAAHFSLAQHLGLDMTRNVLAADLNGDGHTDLFEANATSFHTVWLNDGAGALGRGQRFPVSETQQAAVGDVDRDGDLDLVFATNRSAAQVWLNDSTGQFYDSEERLATPDERLLSVAVGDLNGDGGVDVVLGSHGPLQIWRNTLPTNPAGIFADTGQRLGDGPTAHLLLADLDGDGDLDIVEGLTGVSPAASRFWRNDGDGVFTPGGQAFTQAAVTDIAAGDVDGDGDSDLFFAAHLAADELWLNQGGADPAFVRAAAAFPDLYSAGAAFGDADGDGDLDLAVGSSAGQGNALWLNQGGADPAFVRGDEHLDDAGYNVDVALADLNGDGAPELVFGNNGVNTVYRNQPSGGEADVRVRVCCDHSSYLAVGPSFVTGFEFAITNRGTRAATDLVVAFAPSANINDSHYALPGGVCTSTQCTLASLAPGATVTGTTLHLGLSDRPNNDFTMALANLQVQVTSAGEETATWHNRDFAEHGFYRCEFSTCLIERFFCFLLRDEPLRAGGAAAAFTPHLPIYYALRAEVMAPTASGQAFVQLYADHNQEILALLLADSALRDAAVATLQQWEPALASLVRETGEAPIITATMVAQLDDLLGDLSARGSPALQAGIAAGYALTGPLDQYVGMTIQESRRAMVGFGVYLPVVRG
jgi:hypothetical protein